MPDRPHDPAAATLVPRHLTDHVQVALEDTRVVVVLGARQVGKSTLVEQISDREPPRPIISLDDDATLRGALDDPTGFVADLGTPIAIDEVQRAPNLLLAIKRSVDVDKRPGRFLLTGSANILTAPTIADALTGRTEFLRLWPFSQAELRSTPPRFIGSLFAGDPPRIYEASSGRHAYVEMLVAGGFPEAIRRSGARRASFFDSYLDSVLERDLASLARVNDWANVRMLVTAIAATTGSVVSLDGLARGLGIAANTIRTYLALLETLFLVHRLPAWHSNRLHRLVKAPKLHIVDSGLLAHLLDADPDRILDDGAIAGALVETFAVMEVVRQAAVDLDPPRLYHLRDRDRHEVDLVLERRDGSVVGIEIKASASSGASDFRGLRLMRERLGERFAFGALLYTGPGTVPFGDRLAAVPLSALWAA
jgi:predicted AAA+ superfamily ATPase